MCRSYVAKTMFRALATALGTFLLAAQPAGAQPVPNLGAIQAKIDAETAARIAADTQLQSKLNAETAARLATEAELRASIPGGAETGIVGRYSFSGTNVCLNSPQGFDPVTFLPLLQPAPPQPLPMPPMSPQTVIGPATFVNPSSATVSGFRTFNADGTGTAEAFTHNLGHPGVFYANGFNSNAQPFISTGVSAGMGNASTSHLTGAFTWHIAGGKLIIDDSGPMGFTGPITSGGTRVGWISTTANVPPLVGVLGKDLRIISMVQEVAAIEISVLMSPAGQPFQQFNTPRTCHRERTMRRIEG